MTLSVSLLLQTNVFKKSDQKPLGTWVKRLVEQNVQRIHGVNLGLSFKRFSIYSSSISSE
jgi:hypothetical protein